MSETSFRLYYSYVFASRERENSGYEVNSKSSSDFQQSNIH